MKKKITLVGAAFLFGIVLFACGVDIMSSALLPMFPAVIGVVCGTDKKKAKVAPPPEKDEEKPEEET